MILKKNSCLPLGGEVPSSVVPKPFQFMVGTNEN